MAKIKVLQQILKTDIAEIQIEDRVIGSNQPCFIIAEAGVNHNGDVEIAKQLIKVAAEAGVEAIKFQTFKAEQVTTKLSPTAAYQKKNIGEENQWKLLRPLELKEEAYPELMALAKKMGLIFLSTAHGHIESAKFLLDKVPAWKVGSGDVTNLPFLRFLGQSGKPIFLPTGMATIVEIKEAVETIAAAGNTQVMIMQCTTNYPCPDEEANVAAMIDLQRNFPSYQIGFSDHTMGITADIIAAGYGATVIEKHFTLDRNMEGPDHKASVEPDELKQMVKAIRGVEVLRGTGIKKPFTSEITIAEMARKSVVAARDIPAGSKITNEMLTIKRPEKGGIKPKQLKKIVGKTAKRDIKEDTQLKPGDF